MQQMTLFDCFPDEMSPLKVPILLKPNQKVYEVVRGDIKEYICSNDTWTYCDGEKRAYDLLSVEYEGAHKNATNWDVGKTIFTDFEQAKKQAEKNLKQYDVILAKDMVPAEVVAYAFLHKSDFETEGREVVHFYAKLDNGLIYMHHNCYYDHIPMDQKRAIFEFENIKAHGCAYKKWDLPDYKPTFKNMYRTQNNDHWFYADAGYGYGF